MFVDYVRRHGVLVWTSGISVVLFAAVIPYPIHGLIGGSDLIHRIHDTVGSIQYLPLWAIPVFVHGFRRKSEFILLALMSALAVFVTGVWSATLIASASWMQLATLLPLMRTLRTYRFHFSWWMAPATAVSWLSVFVFSSQLISMQVNADMQNTHALRFHYSGMAAAYMAMALCASVATFQKMERLSVGLIAGSLLSTGLLNILFSNYESALTRSWSIAFLVAGGIALVGIADSVSNRASSH